METTAHQPVTGRAREAVTALFPAAPRRVRERFTAGMVVRAVCGFGVRLAALTYLLAFAAVSFVAALVLASTSHGVEVPAGIRGRSLAPPHLRLPTGEHRSSRPRCRRLRTPRSRRRRVAVMSSTYPTQPVCSQAKHVPAQRSW